MLLAVRKAWDGCSQFNLNVAHKEAPKCFMKRDCAPSVFVGNGTCPALKVQAKTMPETSERAAAGLPPRLSFRRSPAKRC